MLQGLQITHNVSCRMKVKNSRDKLFSTNSLFSKFSGIQSDFGKVLIKFMNAHFLSVPLIFKLFAANGYGRSDGVVMCYIQKVSEAKRCYGTIVSVDTQFNGNTENEFLKIDNKRMKEFLEEFYSNSPIKPEQIDYLETYGCGIKVRTYTKAVE